MPSIDIQGTVHDKLLVLYLIQCKSNSFLDIFKGLFKMSVKFINLLWVSGKFLRDPVLIHCSSSLDKLHYIFPLEYKHMHILPSFPQQK